MNTPSPVLRNAFDRAVWDSVFRDNEYALPDSLDGWCVLDVGANVGAFAILAAQRGALVTACEPCPETAGVLRQSASVYGLTSRILVVEAAVSDRSGQARLSRDVDPAGRNLFRGSPIDPVVRVLSFDAAVDLARAFAGGAARVNLCKIDAEGSEYPILESDPEGLSLVDRLTVEFHDNYVPNARGRASECRTRLAWGVPGFVERCWEATHADHGWYRLYRGERAGV